MSHLAERIKALIHPKHPRPASRLSDRQTEVLRRNLKALLRSKEALAEQAENAA